MTVLYAEILMQCSEMLSFMLKWSLRVPQCQIYLLK